jgi:hypothetical protein
MQLLNIFRTLFDWSEVWALLIPLAFLILYKPKHEWVKPLKWYLLIALLLGIVIDFIWYVNKYDLFNSRKGHRWNNNAFYNLQSIARLLIFSWFFALQGIAYKKLTRILPILFLIFTVILFVFFKPFKDLSSHLMATEAGLLLIYCLQYTYNIIKEEKSTIPTNHPPFWVVGGLTLYTAVNFFIFLFYNYLMNHSQRLKDYAVSIWYLHSNCFL